MFNKLLAAGLAGLSLCCVSCTNVMSSTSTQPGPALPSGVAVLCNDFTGTGVTASIVVSNLATHSPSQKFISPNSTAATVCSQINSAAKDVGLQTDYQTPLTGVRIFGSPQIIEVQCSNIRVQLQTFTGSPTGPGVWTDCPQ